MRTSTFSFSAHFEIDLADSWYSHVRVPINPDYMAFLVKWGSEIQIFDIRKHLNSKLFEGPISNGRTLALYSKDTAEPLHHILCTHL